LMVAAVVAAVNLLFVIGAPQIRPDAELVAAAAGA